MPSEPLIDLAVIGGGIAGCFVAERALALHPEWHVRLFEGDDRIGGRLFTTRADEEGSAIELGGMRYNELHRQVKELFGVSTAPQPRGAYLAQWAPDAMGSAWHSWDPGTRPWETVDRLVQPLADRPLYVCGETYSSWQGWIEGALETAEMVVDRL